MRRTALVAGLLAVALIAAACDRGEDTPGTTTLPGATSSAASVAAADPASEPASSGTSEASADAAAGTSDDPDEDSGTTVDGMPSYEVVERVESDDGDELVVVVEPGTYTNVELQNLVFDIVDRFQPLTAVVVDDPDAAALVLAEDRSDEDQTFLDEHTFLELVDGVDVTFRGPYSDLAGLVIGS